ncbi:MAG: Zn-ribbon domain-containing OB-fold protein [Emcibacter sp.]|nr:Zn-ribbon domain-containing OB-fold protein [Emcibacter sp.]
MPAQTSKILPIPTPETETYWKGCAAHKLLIQYCTNCDHFQFYPRSICTQCMSRDIEWKTASGRATVVSYTVMHRSVSKAYGDEYPQILALVRLKEGPQMMSHIVDCRADKISIGMSVEVTFQDWTDEVSIPVFYPLSS